MSHARMHPPPQDPTTSQSVDGRQTWPQRLVAVALMMTAILVAGGIAGVAKTLDEADQRLYTHVDQDQAVRIGEYGTLRVTGISVGGNLTERESLVPSPGRFVVVEYEIVAGRREAPSIRTELHVGGNVYREVDKAFEPLPAGFAGNRASLFEVPVEMLQGEVEIVFGEGELVYAHQHWVRWRPALTAEQVERSEARTVSLPEATKWVAP